MFNADAQFDSFLTIGRTGPALENGALSTIGLDLDGWGLEQGMSAEDGAVFFMDPSHGATEEPVVFAQLSVPAGTRFEGSLSAQGRSVGGAEDWQANGLQVSANVVYLKFCSLCSFANAQRTRNVSSAIQAGTSAE
eukprot:COSAG04_NODE_17006_length_482_cov_0.926893_1_plen_135_part_10